MKKLILLSLCLSQFAFAQKIPFLDFPKLPTLPGIDLNYYGKASSEAILEFTTFAEIPHTTDITLKDIKKNDKIRYGILKKLDFQIQHLMGTFQSASFLKEFGYPGVLGQLYDIEFLDIKKISSGRKRIDYKFSGKVVFHTDSFGKKKTIDLPIKLPRAYDEVYDLGWDEAKEINHCSDKHYNSEDDFWYFWDPDLSGCALKGDKYNVLRFYGKLKRLPNTKSTYPEYDLLYGDNENGEVMKTSLFLGYIDEVENLHTPNKKDDAYYAMTEVEAGLKAKGFKLTSKKDAFREYASGAVVKGINFYRTYEKDVTTKLGKKIKAQVELLLADTDVNSTDATFHRYLIPALENSDLISYDGHSGLGSNLSIEWLPAFNFRPKKYQIIFFNGCSSYPYFNGDYFEAKGGSKYIELITSGLPTLTDTSATNMLAFIGPFLDGSIQSYQRLMSQIEYSNLGNDTYLIGVSGDEDNKFRP